MKLFLYSDFVKTAWAKNPAHFRQLTNSTERIVLRFAHTETPAPAGYEKGDSCLASDPVISIPSFQDKQQCTTKQ